MLSAEAPAVAHSKVARLVLRAAAASGIIACFLRSYFVNSQYIPLLAFMLITSVVGLAIGISVIWLLRRAVPNFRIRGLGALSCHPPLTRDPATSAEHLAAADGSPFSKRRRWRWRSLGFVALAGVVILCGWVYDRVTSPRRWLPGTYTANSWDG